MPASPESTPLSSIMVRQVLCATPYMSVQQLATALLERNVSGAPVVDRSGRPIGMASKTDVLRACLEHKLDAQDVPVESIMTPLLFSLNETASIARAAELMTFEGVHRLAVIDDEGSLVGIVAPLDVLRWLTQSRAG